uniref:Cryptic/Cripto CFC domain-containing protein n=1 Tax=Terrapene triunguis TaxID=2587831 RepID=A0A674K6G8_9SAUR
IRLGSDIETWCMEVTATLMFGPMAHFCAWQVSLFDRLVPWITSFLLSLLLTQARKLNRSCCQNGGTCFLGSFCICPKHFTEETQFSVTALLCGAIGHGEWTQEGCLFCQCVYGILHCFPQNQEDGCDLVDTVINTLTVAGVLFTLEFSLLLSSVETHQW